MATTQYIGSRYVPILADPVEWSSTKAYEPLTIVTHEGNSYTSRQFVPVGVDITNEQFWAMTGNYNAQVEQYRRETEQAVSRINEWYDEAVTEYADKYGAKPFAFETVEAMRRSRDLLYVGAICHTNGFRASGDGGAAYYIISASGTANDMDVIALNNGLFATFVVTEPYVTPEMFGAYGGGEQDDTEYIQFAIDNYRNVVLSRKRYGVKTINMQSGTKLTGNKSGSTLVPLHDDVIIRVRYALSINISNVAISNADYISRGYYGIGIELSHPNRQTSPNTWSNVFEKLTIVGMRYGVIWTNAGAAVNASDYTSETTFEDCKIFECDYPVYSETPQGVNNIFLNCQLERNNRNGVSSNPLITMKAGKLSFYNCSLIGNGSILYLEHPSSTIAVFPTVTIDNCRLEIHNRTTDTKYIINNNIHASINTEAIVNFINSQVYMHANNTHVYIVRSYGRCNISVENVNIQLAAAMQVSFAHIDSAQGFTGVYNVAYSKIYGKRIAGLSAQSDYSGAVEYVGIAKTFFSNYGANIQQPYVYDAPTQGNKLLFSQGSFGGKVSNKYFTIPFMAMITKIGFVSLASTNQNQKSVSLYAVKNNSLWVDPNATNPSEDDMTLICTCTLGANHTGYAESNVDYNRTGGNIHISGMSADYSEGRYALISDTTGANGLTGRFFLEYI